MSDTDQAYEAVERLEHADRARMTGVTEALRPGFDRRAFLRRTALTGRGGRLGEHAARARAARAPPAAAAPPTCSARIPNYKFVFVNHVTTNSFFVPTQYGIAGRLQAARLLVSVDGLGKRATSTRWSTR